MLRELDDLVVVLLERGAVADGDEGDAALAQLLWRLALGSEGDVAIQLAVATL